MSVTATPRPGNQDRKLRARDERDFHAAHREAQVVHLRMQGYEFDDIAQQCGYANRSGAYKAWKRALQRIPRDAIEEERQAAKLRYNWMRRCLVSKIERGITEAHDSLIRIDERESKLFGYDVKNEAQQAAQVVVRAYPPGWVNAISAPVVDAPQQQQLQHEAVQSEVQG